MVVAAPIRAEVEALLYREARLLDDGQFEAWLELFTDDAHYWCPANADDVDPQQHVSFLYDDRLRMGDRVWRLVHSGAAARYVCNDTSRRCTSYCRAVVVCAPSPSVVDSGRPSAANTLDATSTP